MKLIPILWLLGFPLAKAIDFMMLIAFVDISNLFACDFSKVIDFMVVNETDLQS